MIHVHKMMMIFTLILTQHDVAPFQSRFLAGVAAVVERPELVRKLFVTDEMNEAGVYCIKLCKDGVWQHVLLDGVFPVNSGGALAYAQPSRGQLWVLLLEKAFAKL